MLFICDEIKNTSVCNYCQAYFVPKKGTSGKFCSRSCGGKASPNRVLPRVSDPTKKAQVICPTCNKEFLTYINDGRKHCSKKCVKTGGYRANSGRAKSGYYKGIYCGSTYELIWVIYNLDHDIQFSRFETTLQSLDAKLKYIPDFLLADGKTIIEIKGHEDEKVAKKTALAESLGYKVVLLKKNDMLHMFDYVKSKYSTTLYYDLYDNFKPEFQYICAECSVTFLSKTKRKNDPRVKIKGPFCTKSCARKANHRLKKQFAV